MLIIIVIGYRKSEFFNEMSLLRPKFSFSFYIAEKKQMTTHRESN